MKSRLLILAGLLLFLGCAAYKQLMPLPALSPAEQGFQELKGKDGTFQLKKEKKYFVAFPAPADKNFYLVLDVPAKAQLGSWFTTELPKKKMSDYKVKDETLQPESTSVYAVQSGTAGYYWLIETVSADMAITLKYRYVPQWRFKFENRHAVFSATLKENVVDRKEYLALGTSFHFSPTYDFAGALASTDKHLAEINKVHAELLAIESIFPASILNSQDKAYQDYLALKKELEEERTFQMNWIDVLTFSQREIKTRGQVPEFLAQLDNDAAFFAQKSRYPENVVQECQKVIKTRLDETAPFYNGLVAEKTDWQPFAEGPFHLAALPKISTLYQAAGLTPADDIVNAGKFITEFNQKSTALTAAGQALEKAAAAERALAEMPADNFFPGLIMELGAAQQSLPVAIGPEHALYKNFRSTAALNMEIRNTAGKIDELRGRYSLAAGLVPELNAFKARTEYTRMIELLSRNRKLGFLLERYAGLDNLSVEKQAKDIRTALGGQQWPAAEAGLQQLHADRTFLNPAAIEQKRRSAVLELEDALYAGIDQVTRQKILAFVDEKVNQLQNVDSLYTDPVFLPAYDVTFSSGSQQNLLDKKKELVGMLAAMKDNEFPAKAITLLYEEFMKNPDDNGVLKARAVVTHGKHYKADDKKVRIRMAELDPLLPKRVTQVKEYRRVFALPVTDKETGSNRYLCRLDLDVPSDAAFPVWDVTIKLPPAVAKNAAAEQWYEKLVLNDQVLKNEGRFSISAPSVENEYECQISPVQTKKDGRNILEIYFNHKSFKAYPISVMAQKPIIKKN
jgi:hypothetical protein